MATHISNRRGVVRASVVRERMDRDLGKFFDAYVEAALWSTNDESDDSGGEPLDKNYSSDDIVPGTIKAMEDDCRAFWEKNKDKIFDDESKEIDDWGAISLAGHDFWLTRNGHGAGFWDGGWPKHGDALTKAAEKFGEVYLYVGDDNLIYQSGADAELRSGNVREGTRVHMPRMDGDYAVQQLYRNGTLVGGDSEEWYDDEQEAIGKARKIARASWFEGDYTRVITRDGELVWQSHEGKAYRGTAEHRTREATGHVAARRKIAGRGSRLVPGETIHVRIKDIGGNTLEQFNYPIPYEVDTEELALRFSDTTAPGTEIVLSMDRDQWIYRKEKFAGNNSVTRVKENGTVRDYEVIDGRTDRHRAGPFKTRGEADDAKGPGDVVRFVPSRGVREFTKSQHHFTNGYNQIAPGIKVWVSGDEPTRVTISNGKGREFAERVVRSWWGSQALHFSWTDTKNADISRDYTKTLRANKKVASPKARRSAPRGKKRR